MFDEEVGLGPGVRRREREIVIPVHALTFFALAWGEKKGGDEFNKQEKELN